MRFVFKSLLSVFILSAFLIGCGSSTRNEQGTSVTLSQIVQSLAGSADAAGGAGGGGAAGGGVAAIGLSGLVIPLSEATGSALAAVQLRNNLGTQTFRAEKVNLRYTVPGANINVPDFFFPLGLVLGPNLNNIPDGTSGSTLPDQGELLNVGTGDFPILPAEILSFLLLNQEALPETPFTAIAMISVEGITSAGDRLETNLLNFPITFTSTPSGSELLSSVTAGGTAAAAAGREPANQASDEVDTSANRDDSDTAVSDDSEV